MNFSRVSTTLARAAAPLVGLPAHPPAPHTAPRAASRSTAARSCGATAAGPPPHTPPSASFDWWRPRGCAGSGGRVRGASCLGRVDYQASFTPPTAGRFGGKSRLRFPCCSPTLVHPQQLRSFERLAPGCCWNWAVSPRHCPAAFFLSPPLHRTLVWLNPSIASP